MNKQTFFTELKQKLHDLGVADEYTERHIKQFEAFFEGKSDEEVETEIEKLGSIDRAAARIKRMTDKLIEEEKASASDEADKKDGHSSKEKKSASLSEDDLKIDLSKDSGKADSSDADMSDSEVKNHDSEARGDENRSEKKKTDDTHLKTYAPDSEMIKKNTLKFRILCVVTLPITLLIAFTVLMLFSLTFFAIALLIILAIAALVALTAGGTVITVFGLIFGVVELLSTLPIGLYECGLSLMIGSASLFVGILIYNFAVVLMPFAAKYLFKFLKYVIKKARELYVYLKKECIGA